MQLDFSCAQSIPRKPLLSYFGQFPAVLIVFGLRWTYSGEFGAVPRGSLRGTRPVFMARNTPPLPSTCSAG